MDIQAKAPYPLNQLSNFAAHNFVFKGTLCASMEGLLQSLKFRDPTRQAKTCLMSGKAAKDAGLTAPDWRESRVLWWQGHAINRDSTEYQNFLNEAYSALFQQSEPFRKALAETGKEPLTHSIGLSDTKETILTEKEFCERLMRLRTDRQPGQNRTFNPSGAP